MKSEIENIVNDQLLQDQFLVDVLVKGNDTNPKLVVLVDSDKGMTIDACASLSRKISGELDTQDVVGGRYTLEVSSPGADRPLENLRQFRRNIGRKLEVKRKNGKVFEGLLIGVEEDSLAFSLDSFANQKRKEILDRSVELPFDEIESARVLISFK